MDKEKAKEFFEEVKGKKLYWTSWVDKDYFIPDDIDEDSTLFGPSIMGMLYAEIGTTYPTVLTIHNGFDEYKGERWVLLKDVKESKNGECVCTSRDLFNFGCKCGAVKK